MGRRGDLQTAWHILQSRDNMFAVRMLTLKTFGQSDHGSEKHSSIEMTVLDADMASTSENILGSGLTNSEANMHSLNRIIMPYVDNHLRMMRPKCFGHVGSDRLDILVLFHSILVKGIHSQYTIITAMNIHSDAVLLRCLAYSNHLSSMTHEQA